MADSLVMEQWHITVTASRDLPKKEYATIVRTLRGKSLLARLNDGVAEVLQRSPSLKNVKFIIDRCFIRSGTGAPILQL